MQTTLGKRIAITCGLVFGLYFASSAQAQGKSPDTSDAGQELMQLERDWSAAYLRHDTVTISRILADDYVGTDGRAFMTNKAQEIEDAQAPKADDPAPDFVVLNENVTDMKVRMYGDMGIVNARSMEKARFKGKDIDIQ